MEQHLAAAPFSPLRTQTVSIHQGCREVSRDSIKHTQKQQVRPALLEKHQPTLLQHA